MRFQCGKIRHFNCDSQASYEKSPFLSVAERGIFLIGARCVRVLFGLFEGEGAGALVANFRDPSTGWVGINEGGLFSPFFALSGEGLEGLAIELHESPCGSRGFISP